MPWILCFGCLLEAEGAEMEPYECNCSWIPSKEQVEDLNRKYPPQGES